VDRDAALVAALGAAVLAGCTQRRVPVPPSPSRSSTASPAADPAVAVLLGWEASERRLAALHASALRRVPGLTTLRRNHLARAGAIADRLRARGVASPSPTPAVRPLHGKPPALVAALVAAERGAATAYLGALARVDADLATLGAELAAGARQHAVVLRLLPS
jgi:hypothetical protein